MARNKDIDWNLPKVGDAGHSVQMSTLAVLMDIRDELKVMRQLQERTLGCYRFVNMPSVVDRIDKRLSKKIKLTSVRKS